MNLFGSVQAHDRWSLFTGVNDLVVKSIKENPRKYKFNFLIEIDHWIVSKQQLDRHMLDFGNRYFYDIKNIAKNTYSISWEKDLLKDNRKNRRRV